MTAASRHLPAALTIAPSAARPGGKRVPFGWRAFPVLADAQWHTTRLHWSGGQSSATGAAHLRITTALDERQRRQIDIRLAESGRRIRQLDMGFPHACQIFDIPLSRQQTAAAMAEGIALSMTDGGAPLWLFGEESPRGPGHECLLPHLMWAGQQPREEAMLDRLCSLTSLQPFGWMEGCVLDGLCDLAASPHASHRGAAAEALNAHLDLFFPGQGIRYENPRSEPKDDVVEGIESTLMYAALARHRPDHPAIDKAIEFWTGGADEQGMIGGNATCEGCYTLAWPLAVLARQRGRDDLAELAWKQLAHRRDRLARESAIYLRHYADGRHTFQSWARGVAWYLLGFVRTLHELREFNPPQDLRAECARALDWAASYQGEDGLWFCFFDDPATGVETSGSAGIAAALSLAAGRGLAGSGDQARAAAARCARALPAHMAPDGLLGGVAPSNKAQAGEEHQRSGFRTHLQLGMGLAGQLMAALAEDTNTSAIET